jgi:4-hydroxy-2-oxoheptanedioate aldolase
MSITDIHAHFASGGKAVNGWCPMPSTVTAEIMGRQGFDLLTVDLQHGLIDCVFWQSIRTQITRRK